MHVLIRRSLIVPLALWIAAAAWAGQEYPAQPGETVKPGELIVKLKAGALSSLILAYLPGAQVTALSHLNLFHVKAGLLPANVASLLAADGLVDFVEPNRVRHANVGQPNDADFSQQWPLVNLGAVQAWTLFPNQYLTAATAGTGRVKVAVLDTGIDCTHPDFMNVGASSTDSASGGQLLWSASQAPVATSLASPACPWQDDYGHGTHVSGILAAAANNGIGVAGLAYPVQLVAYKVLDNTGSGTDVVIADAIMSAADAGIPIISLSLGGAGYSQTLQLAVNYAWQRNSLVIAAAGNSASNAIFYPADASFAVGVSATDVNSNFASFSNYGNGVALAGPGVNVLSTLPAYSVTLSSSTGYGYLSGTSMSTPHVSAVAGLVETTTPGTSVAAVRLRLEQTATSNTVGGGWNQDFGYGIVNAYDAVSGTLRAAANGGVTGQVTDSNANPIANATVIVGGSPLTTDGSGLFRFGPFSPGTYAVQVSASTYTTQNLTVTVPPGADATLAVMMGVSYGRFTGTVTDDSAGVSNAVVQAVSANLIQGTTIADTSGNYTLWAPVGTYNLLVTNIGEVNTIVTGQTITAGGTTTANLTIARFGSISGTVTNPTGAPVASATVSITGGIVPITVTTGANGQFSASGLASGSYTLVCSDFAFTATTVAGLVVSPENVTTANCQLAVLSLAPWSNRKPITILHGEVSGGASLTNFPVLISLASDANLAQLAQASGNDILFTAADGVTKLSHQIESYTTASGQLVAWVQVPSVSSTADTMIYMYYGNPSAGNQQNPGGTWDSNYKIVWHMADDASSATVLDGTSNSNDGTASVNTNTISGSGVIGGDLNMTSAVTELGDNATLHSTTLTMSMWLQLKASGSFWYYYNKGSNNWYWFYAYYPGSTVYVHYTDGTNTDHVFGFKPPAWVDGSWHSFTFTVNADVPQSVYWDGTAQSGTFSSNGTNTQSLTGPIVLGDGPGTPMEELRLSSVVRSTGWIATEYTNQNSPSAFVSVGPQQTNGGGSTVSITVTSAPTGLAVTVDSVACAATPCSYQWTPGTPHTLVAATQAGSTGTQYIFGSWTGNAGSPDQVTAPSTATTYTASFTTQYFLTTSANPSAEGSISPLSEWVNAGTMVSVSATATTGNQFLNFTGALTGTTTPQNLTMNAAATVTATFSPVGGTGWYTSWSNRKPITILHGEVSGGASLTNFPVLISLASDANLAQLAQASGNDILFTGSDGVTKLSHQIESYTASSGRLVAWVQVPSVSSTADTMIYMYYGNPSAANQQQAAQVWDSNYLGVWHFPNGTTLNASDSTANADNGTIHGATATTGQIDGGASFNGTSNSISIPGASGTGTYTISMWVNDSSTSGMAFGTFGSGSGSEGSHLIIYPVNNQAGFYDSSGGGFTYLGSGLSSGVMRYMVYVMSVASGTVTIYNNGISLGTGSYNNVGSLDAAYTQIGADYDGASSFFGGIIDEFRISSIVRSPGWIATEYNNQNSPSAFVSVGAQQQPSM
jgi:thermitase